MTNDAENLFYFYFKVDLLFIMWLLDWDSHKRTKEEGKKKNLQIWIQNHEQNGNKNIHVNNYLKWK